MPQHMNNQEYLDLSPIEFPESEDLNIEQAFAKFHTTNPHVYKNLVLMARQLTKKGRKRIGIKMLFEALRWSHMLVNDPSSDFKLNNNFTSRYARLIAANEHDLSSVFQFRELKAE